MNEKKILKAIEKVKEERAEARTLEKRIQALATKEKALLDRELSLFQREQTLFKKRTLLPGRDKQVALKVREETLIEKEQALLEKERSLNTQETALTQSAKAHEGETVQRPIKAETVLIEAVCEAYGIDPEYVLASSVKDSGEVIILTTGGSKIRWNCGDRVKSLEPVQIDGIPRSEPKPLVENTAKKWPVIRGWSGSKEKRPNA